MFTGIIAELGTVTAISNSDDAARITISSHMLQDIEVGESVAVNGVCLTAIDPAAGVISADVMAETLSRSSLAGIAVGDRVNLERPVTPDTMLGGHVVQGHVDGVAVVTDRRPGDGWEVVEIELPAGLSRYVVEKGSITLDGISLTVVSVDADRLTVSLIPETLRRTTMGFRAVGDRINVEVDVLAKYVERLLTTAGKI